RKTVRLFPGFQVAWRAVRRRRRRQRRRVRLSAAVQKAATLPHPPVAAPRLPKARLPGERSSPWEGQSVAAANSALVHRGLGAPGAPPGPLGGHAGRARPVVRRRSRARAPRV
ncbi:hypothetical protein M885DRAFT_612656, partial [Pelagophyceae sp. CCMP2097]